MIAYAAATNPTDQSGRNGSKITAAAHRPADEQVQDVIDRVRVVAPVIRDKLIELGGTRHR